MKFKAPAPRWGFFVWDMSGADCGAFCYHTSVRVFDSGHTTMATPMAMPAPHAPQIALTRTMIAVAMHALPSSLGFAGVLCQMPLDLLHACMPALVAE
jgi:hypothetical protein